jgi:tRNA-splicing endonuclease subunit Sen54
MYNSQPRDYEPVFFHSAHTTPMPSLAELNALFDVLPELPSPLPRQKPQIASESAPKPTTLPSTPILPDRTLFRRVFAWAFPSPPTQVRKPNPFAALKAGKKTVVVAVVDVGNVSFFRFSQGSFSDWPMSCESLHLNCLSQT